MAIIYCGMTKNKPYYIKEADIKITSIQELAYFIFNYAMLITNKFINKYLILYIANDLDMPNLANEINILYNKKENNIAEILKLILRYSNYYSEKDLRTFDNHLYELIDLKQNEFINLAGDKLYNLKKYDKAISQYVKISNEDNEALKKLAYCYAKLQIYDKAINYLITLYERTNDKNVLKDLYYCYKLNGTADEFSNYKNEISEDEVANWELDIVKKILNAKNSENIKEIEDTFLMGEAQIKEYFKNRIEYLKEKYRYIS